LAPELDAARELVLSGAVIEAVESIVGEVR
jgi:hypothetical protein